MLPCFSKPGTVQMLRGIIARGALLPGDLMAIEAAIALIEYRPAQSAAITPVIGELT